MPLPSTLLLLAVILPLISAGVLLLYGRKLGDPFAGIVGTVFMGASLCCTLLAMTSWLSRTDGQAWGYNALPISLTTRWIPIGLPGDAQGLQQDHAGWLDVGIYIDSLTIALFNMITLVATLVHVFAIAYVGRDRSFARFFATLGFFCFSMLALVLSATLLQILIFWELVGLSSYLLIGFWTTRPAAASAATKAFVMNRVGDTGFLIGLGMLLLWVGNATLPDLWSLLGNAGAGQGVTLPDGSHVSDFVLTIAGIALFWGAIGKSAQFPLHTWLPTAMEGPSPVSALIHAATMVAAGVYLVGRVFPILTPDAKLYIAVTGLITLVVGALCATVQRDIKRLLAYSTISQLGYMMLAMGVGSWTGGLFHLITHAFFKALLFLGAGSVIHAMHHEQRMSQFGGLLRRLPVTAITFGIAALAIAGAPFLAGAYSKDLIITHAGAFVELAHAQGYGWASDLLFILPVCAGGLTAFYITRCWMLTFWGKPRNQHLADRAYERPTMWVPLIALAAMSIIGGTFLGVRGLLKGAMSESAAIVATMTPVGLPVSTSATARDPFATAWEEGTPEPVSPDATLLDVEPEVPLSTAEQAVQNSLHRTESIMPWLFAAGAVSGFLLYVGGPGVTGRLGAMPGVKQVVDWIEAGFYLDDLYTHVFAAVTLAGAHLAAGVDRMILDPLISLVSWLVRGCARLAETTDRLLVDGAITGIAGFWQGTGALIRLPQSGKIRAYVLIMLASLTVGIAAVVWWQIVRWPR